MFLVISKVLVLSRSVDRAFLCICVSGAKEKKENRKKIVAVSVLK